MSNLSKLIVSKFLGNLYFAVPIQTFFLFGRGLSFAHIMLLQSIHLLADVLFEIPTGVIGDKIGRKWSIVTGKLINLLAWIPWFFLQDFTGFAIAYFVFGIGDAFQSGSDQALIYDDLKERKQESAMQRYMGRYLASATLGFAVASLVGGYLSQPGTMDAYLFLYVLTCVFHGLGFLISLTLREPAASPAAKKQERSMEAALLHFHKALKHLLSHRKLRRIFLLSLFTMPFSFILLFLFQPYFAQAQVPSAWFGIAVFLASGASLTAKLNAYRIERLLGPSRAAFATTALPGLSWIALSFVFHPVLSVAMYVLTDMLGNLRDPIFSDYTNRHIASENRATVISTIHLAQSVYMMLMRPVVGIIADANLRYACIFMGCVILAAAIGLRISEEDTRTA